MYSNVEEDLNTSLDINQIDLYYLSFSQKCIKSIKNIVLTMYMLFYMTTQRICKYICKVCKICKNFECTKCKNTEVKIKDSLFCEILKFIQIFALQFVIYNSKFHQNSKIALAINEYRKSVLQKFIFAKDTFVKCVRTVKTRKNTGKIYTSVNISKVNASEKSVYSTILNKSNWILDSDATTHICCDKSYFVNMRSSDTRIS